MNSFRGIFPILNVEFQSTQQIFVLMKTPRFRLRIHKASIFRKRLSHTSSRRLWDVFNSFPRRTAKTIIYRKIRLGHTSEKFTIRVQAEKVPKSDLFGYTETFKTFLESILCMKWLLLQTKILLLKLGIWKDIAVSVKKKWMNKSSSKNVLFFRFTTSFSGYLQRPI